MAVLQPLVDLVELCFLHGVEHAVISPGSRSAALTIAFDKHPGITTHMVMDERAAGFIALGMAQQQCKTVVLVCTSGSAAYNYAPAVTEAFFQKIPLLVLTADRPPEWIHQQDGQTIYQSGIFGKHVKKSFDFPVDYSHPDSLWFANRLTNESLLATMNPMSGPVHINVPIREPFYPTHSEEITFREVRKIEVLPVTSHLNEESWVQIKKELHSFKRIMVAVGQMNYDPVLIYNLENLAKRDSRFVIVGDSISNLPAIDDFLVNLDALLPVIENDLAYVPELVITSGKSFLSKSFKKFIRSNPSIIHWNVGDCEELIDSFGLISTQIPINFIDFIQNIATDNIHLDENDVYKQGEIVSYGSKWKGNNLIIREICSDLIEDKCVYSDVWIVRAFLEVLPENTQLHVANSMSVRYVNFIGVPPKNIEVFANRGTSGIDGCVSTAIGAALLTTQSVYLLIGDVAFLYDRNGLLLENLPQNLKILILNNSGGNIFRIIEGSSTQTEVSRLFETRHHFTAKHTALDSKIEYQTVESKEEFYEKITVFIGSDKASVLEVLTSPVESAQAFKWLKSALQDQFKKQ